MTKKQVLKNNLYNLLKNDIAIEIYNNQNNDEMIFNFFHLDSVYNGLIWYNFKNNTYNIDFQYHDYTKKIDRLLIKLMEAIKINKKDDIIKEIEFFRNLSKQLFNCKYNLNITLHIHND